MAAMDSLVFRLKADAEKKINKSDINEEKEG